MIPDLAPQAYSILLLNLDRDADRLAHMKAQLAHLGLSFTRQPGILGDELPDDLRPFFTPIAAALKRGEIGCYASHLRAMQRLAAGELGDCALILEDDIVFADDFPRTLDAALRALPEGWDILRLSNPTKHAYIPLARLTRGGEGDRFLVRYAVIPNNAGAYLISRQGARKFLAHPLEPRPVDDELRRPWLHGLDTYGLVPPPVTPGAFGPSTIDALEARGVLPKPPRAKRAAQSPRAALSLALRRLSYNISTLGLSGWLACRLIDALNAIPFLRRRAFLAAAARLFPGSRHDL